MAKVVPTTLDGFMELLPAEQILFNKMLDVIRETYELFGFSPLDTPAVEKLEVLLAKSGGETTKQILPLQKEGQALRFDLTVPLARYVAQRYRDLAFPFRRYQLAKVYRGERPQKGRYREFYQCDIDIIGDGQLGLINDAEIPSIIYAVFQRLGFGPFTIRINNRKILNGFFCSQNITGEQQKEVLRVIDRLDKIGKNGVSQELAELEVPEATISKIFGFIGITGKNSDIIEQLKGLGIADETFNAGVDELDTVINAIRRFGVPEENVAIDLKIARGLDYYTGTVYETALNDYPEVGSICSGGRYDNLAECYTDKNLPGVGISIGLTRLFSKLLEMQIIKTSGSTSAQLLIIPMDDQLDKAIEASARFRQSGISAMVYSEQAKPAKAFKYANRLKVPFVAIIGGQEVSQGKISVKNMMTGVQQLTTVSEAIELIQHRGEG